MSTTTKEKPATVQAGKHTTEAGKGSGKADAPPPICPLYHGAQRNASPKRGQRKMTITITENKIEQARKAIEAQQERSAWGRGVTAYALDILDTVQERAEYEGHEPTTYEELKDYALNGAVEYRKPRDTFAAWSVASWGGSYLIYNGDIAARLCSPSELKKTRDGERRPNSREEWLDVQARALFQAFNRLARVYPFKD